MRRRLAAVAAALACTACASLAPPAPGVSGKPLAEFFDDLKAELRAVHWRIRSASAACGSAQPREVDLRNATVTLELARVGEVNVDGDVRLVAIPLGGGAIAPFGSASAARKWTQEMTVKLDVRGPARL
jgi:hypothetical protein